MRVLVTGGAGYIGSHTAKALASTGFEPIVLDNLSSGHRWAVRWGPFVEGDLGHQQSLVSVLQKYHIEAVIHFAASAYVGESMQNAGKYFRNNTANSLNLLEAMVDTQVRTIVFSSTCATYGIPEAVPVREDAPQRPINPYGESKLLVERALRWYGEVHGLHWVALRYFNAAGADPEREIGEVHDPETHLIPLLIQAALGRRPAVQLYGTDYGTPDGTAIRDYIHVADLAAAHVLALRYLLDGGTSQAFNLGTGLGHSVREVVRTVERVSRHRVPVREVGRRPGDPAILVADATKASQLLHWCPRYPALVDSVATAWQWFVKD